MSPEATFDALSVVGHLELTLDRVLPSEVHLFAYLACLLSLYTGRPVSDWAYTFAGTAEGAPFSADLDDALSALRASGDLQGSTLGFELSERGRTEYDLLRDLSQNADREVFVAGACTSALALPVAVVRSAMFQEPALRKAASMQAARQLLEKVDLTVLYEQFGALSTALEGEVRDLIVPAVAWLTYLVRTAKGDAADAAS
jgi:hypothetical protein